MFCPSCNLKINLNSFIHYTNVIKVNTHQPRRHPLSRLSQQFHAYIKPFKYIDVIFKHLCKYDFDTVVSKLERIVISIYIKVRWRETFQEVKGKHGVGVVMNTSRLFPCSVSVQCVFKVSQWPEFSSDSGLSVWSCLVFPVPAWVSVQVLQLPPTV